MRIAGCYEQSSSLYMQGCPLTKSGVGGGLLSIIPGVGGIGIVSPPLNVHGNSWRGLRMLEYLFNLKPFTSKGTTCEFKDEKPLWCYE